MDAKTQAEQLIVNQTIAEQLLSMEKKVFLFQVTAGLRSNRTGCFCQGSPVSMGWYESKQKAELAYLVQYPAVAGEDLRGVWEIMTTQLK